MSIESGPGKTMGAAPGRGRSLRIRGVVIFVLIIVEVLIGNTLAFESTYSLAVLAAHVLVGLLIAAFAGHAMAIARRAYGGAARASAILTTVSIVIAGIGGAVFLLNSGIVAGLDAMEGFAVLALIGSILLIVFGGRRSAPTTATPG